MRKLKFSQADIVRAIKGVKSAGLGVAKIEIEPDGRIIVFTAASEPEAVKHEGYFEAQRRRRSGDVLSERSEPEPTTAAEGFLQDYYRQIGFDPKTMDESELPRLQKIAVEKWRASIPGTPLNKRERKALIALKRFEVGVLVKNEQLSIGINTAERLATRGFIEIRFKGPEHTEGHVLTAPGLVASRELADDARSADRS